MVISPLNHMFWRSVAEAILIDRHMLFYGELLVFMQKVALILVYYIKKNHGYRGVHVMRVCAYDKDRGYSLEPTQIRVS